MKTYLMTRTVLFIAFLALMGCSSDDPMPIPSTPEKPGTKYLSIIPTISSVQQTKSGIISKFVDDDQIGVFATEGDIWTKYNGKETSVNMPATFFKDTWTIATNLEVKTDGVAYAYYPYNKSVKDGKWVPIETTSQTDYLYSEKATFTPLQPTTILKMKHALSLVSVRVKKNDYQFAGHLEKIEIKGLYSSGTMDISTGSIKTAGELSSYSKDVDIILNDNDIVKTESIVFPTNIRETPVTISITVDNKVLSYDIPIDHTWGAGFEYIYTVNLSKQPEEIPEVEFERQYWEKFGKNDNIKIGSNAAYPNLTIEMGDTYYGRTLVKGEAYIFMPCLTNRNKTDFVGKIKLTLWDENKMVEQFPAYNIIATKNYFTTYEIPSFVNCEPGTYKLVPLFQTEGSTEWFVPPYGGGVEDDDWMFTVQGENKYPALRDLKPEGYEPGSGIISEVKLGENFNMEYTLTNRAGIHVKGEIKAVFERTFTNEFRPAWQNDGDTYEDEIGKTSIDIEAGINVHKALISCCIMKKHDTWAISGPSIHLYFKAEDTNNWVLIRSDADQELQRWKDITGPERMWILTGYNYWQVIHPEDRPK